MEGVKLHECVFKDIPWRVWVCVWECACARTCVFVCVQKWLYRTEMNEQGRCWRNAERKLWVLERESECVCLCNTPMSLYEWVDAVDGRQLQQCDSRAELHRYQRWHFGLHYPPTAPRETDGNSSSSGHITPPSLPPLQPQPLPELVNLKALLPDALSALAWLWLDPLCHTAVSYRHQTPQCTADSYLVLNPPTTLTKSASSFNLISSCQTDSPDCREKNDREEGFLSVCVCVLLLPRRRTGKDGELYSSTQ